MFYYILHTNGYQACELNYMACMWDQQAFQEIICSILKQMLDYTATDFSLAFYYHSFLPHKF